MLQVSGCDGCSPLVHPWIRVVAEAILTLSFDFKRVRFSSRVICSGHSDDLFLCSLLFQFATYYPSKNMQVFFLTETGFHLSGDESFSCLWSYIL